MRFALPLLAVALLFAAGCQQVFTYSLAEPLARPPEALTRIDAAGAAAFAQNLAANPDPEMAQAAIGALAKLVESDSSPAVLADAAAVAVVATGLDGAITEAMTLIDLEGLMAGTPLTADEIADLSALVGGVADNVGTDTTAIFTALAGADPAALAAEGVGVQTIVVAAAAIALADMAEQGFSVESIIDGSAGGYTPDPVIADLVALAAGLEPDNQLLATFQGLGFIP